MAYFPNGTSGMVYQERYCCRCKNYRDKGDGRGAGCAIWDLHLFFSYEECNNTGKVEGKPRTNAKDMLDTLIPMDKETHFPAECSMFLEMPLEEVEARDKAFNEQARAEAESEGRASVLHRPNTGPSVLPSMLAWAKARGVVV
jgi:hypothetical protein